MGRSLRSKAVNLVSDLTTVILNPLSDKPSSSSATDDDHENNTKGSPLEPIKEYSGNTVDEPDTSSFTAFLYSLLSSSNAKGNSKVEGHNDEHPAEPEASTTSRKDGNINHKRSMLSRGRHSLGRAFYHTSRMVGYKNTERKSDSDVNIEGGDAASDDDTGVELRTMDSFTESCSTTWCSRNFGAFITSFRQDPECTIWITSICSSGKKVATVIQVVGDRKDVVFGGLVEAPLRPTNKKKYQGTNSTFVFTNASGHPAIFCPTGANRYYTLCSTEYLAIGGSGHFALYLDGDLLSGSSSESETYGNPCLSHSENFEVKEVELWGFVHASKYEEKLAQSQTEAPGICRW